MSVKLCLVVVAASHSCIIIWWLVQLCTQNYITSCQRGVHLHPPYPATRVCKGNDIHMLCIPAHTTNIFNVSAFKSSKSFHYKACKKQLAQHPNRVNTTEQIAGLIGRAWPQAITPVNMMSEFIILIFLQTSELPPAYGSLQILCQSQVLRSWGHTLHVRRRSGLETYYCWQLLKIWTSLEACPNNMTPLSVLYVFAGSTVFARSDAALKISYMEVLHNYCRSKILLFWMPIPLDNSSTPLSQVDKFKYILVQIIIDIICRHLYNVYKTRCSLLTLYPP